jgi:hypothetical protein
MGKARTWTDEQLVEAVAASRSLAEALRLMKLRPGGGQYVAIYQHIERLGLSTVHWSGQGWRKGASGGAVAPRPLEELLVENMNISTHRLKQRLLAAGLLAPRCAVCGIERWMGRPAPLELDHINGNRLDQRIENLRLLCPNCHAQTDNYCGRNKGRVAYRDQVRM